MDWYSEEVLEGCECYIAQHTDKKKLDIRATSMLRIHKKAVMM